MATELHISIPENNGFQSTDIKRTGNVWTAIGHIIIAVVGSGLVSIAWDVAQLGWIAGPIVILLFGALTYYTSLLLAQIYRYGHPLCGTRNTTYIGAVQLHLGHRHAKLCGLIQYLNLFGVAIGYTVVASISMRAIHRSNCFHGKEENGNCHKSLYISIFGAVQIILSQIICFDQVWWFSILALVLVFIHSSLSIALGIAMVVGNRKFKGSLIGISIGDVTQMEKIWRIFQAIGDIALSYSYSTVLIEIQDTLRSPPSESKTMKKATQISLVVTTIVYTLSGCFGYAAFGDSTPSYFLTGFEFYNPNWLVNITHIAIIIQVMCAYQLDCQLMFTSIEKFVSDKFPNNHFITNDIQIFHLFNINLFKLFWRSLFVIIITIVSIFLPSINNIMKLVGALSYWPLTIYYPIKMHITQKEIPKWSTKWMGLQILNVACLIITIAVAAGSIAGMVHDFKSYK